MACICEDDGIDADCEVHGTMTDQEQAPVDLAEGERLLAELLAQHQMQPGPKRYGDALRFSLALVTALKAATTKIARACGCTFNIKTLQREECSFHAELRDDLARVEAEREIYHDAFFRRDGKIQELQARIVELEGSLRERDALLDDVHEWRTEPRTTASSG